MNTFWLKVAAGAVLIVIAIILIGKIRSRDSQPAPSNRSEQKTVYDSFKRDDEKFGIDYEQGVAAGKSGQTQPQQPAQPPQSTPPTTPLPPSAPQPASPPAPKPTFVKLSLTEEVEAQRLFEMAKAERKMGRLPVMGFKKMIDYCREIIRRWPQSEYAFQAKRMLDDVPERYKKMHNVTKEDLDLSNFYQQSNQ